MRAKFEAESTFYFVSAAKLRESTQKILPVMQELRGRDGWLERREMIWEKACAGSYSGKYLAISHRWETPESPDTKGVQLREVKRP